MFLLAVESFRCARGPMLCSTSWSFFVISFPGTGTGKMEKLMESDLLDAIFDGKSSIQVEDFPDESSGAQMGPIFRTCWEVFGVPTVRSHGSI